MSELDMQVTFNGSVYDLIYNSQTGYYEVELNTPSTRWSIFFRYSI